MRYFLILKVINSVRILLTFYSHHPTEIVTLRQYLITVFKDIHRLRNLINTNKA